MGRNEYKREYYQANRERLLEYQKKYNDQKREAIRSYQKKYYQENKEHLAEYARRYYKKHPEKARGYRKKYRRKLKDSRPKKPEPEPKRLTEIQEAMFNQEMPYNHDLWMMESCKSYEDDEIKPASLIRWIEKNNYKPPEK